MSVFCPENGFEFDQILEKLAGSEKIVSDSQKPPILGSVIYAWKIRKENDNCIIETFSLSPSADLEEDSCYIVMHTYGEVPRLETRVSYNAFASFCADAMRVCAPKSLRSPLADSNFYDIYQWDGNKAKPELKKAAHEKTQQLQSSLIDTTKRLSGSLHSCLVRGISLIPFTTGTEPSPPTTEITRGNQIFYRVKIKLFNTGKDSKSYQPIKSSNLGPRSLSLVKKEGQKQYQKQQEDGENATFQSQNTDKHRYSNNKSVYTQNETSSLTTSPFKDEPILRKDSRSPKYVNSRYPQSTFKNKQEISTPSVSKGKVMGSSASTSTSTLPTPSTPSNQTNISHQSTVTQPTPQQANKTEKSTLTNEKSTSISEESSSEESSNEESSSEESSNESEESSSESEESSSEKSSSSEESSKEESSNKQSSNKQSSAESSSEESSSEESSSEESSSEESSSEESSSEESDEDSTKPTIQNENLSTPRRIKRYTLAELRSMEKLPKSSQIPPNFSFSTIAPLTKKYQKADEYEPSPNYYNNKTKHDVSGVTGPYNSENLSSKGKEMTPTKTTTGGSYVQHKSRGGTWDQKTNKSKSYPSHNDNKSIKSKAEQKPVHTENKIQENKIQERTLVPFFSSEREACGEDVISKTPSHTSVSSSSSVSSVSSSATSPTHNSISKVKATPTTPTIPTKTKIDSQINSTDTTTTPKSDISTPMATPITTTSTSPIRVTSVACPISPVTPTAPAAVITSLKASLASNLIPDASFTTPTLNLPIVKDSSQSHISCFPNLDPIEDLIENDLGIFSDSKSLSLGFSGDFGGIFSSTIDDNFLDPSETSMIGSLFFPTIGFGNDLFPEKTIDGQLFGKSIWNAGNLIDDQTFIEQKNHFFPDFLLQQQENQSPSHSQTIQKQGILTQEESQTIGKQQQQQQLSSNIQQSSPHSSVMNTPQSQSQVLPSMNTTPTSAPSTPATPTSTTTSTPTTPTSNPLAKLHGQHFSGESFFQHLKKSMGDQNQNQNQNPGIVSSSPTNSNTNDKQQNSPKTLLNNIGGINSPNQHSTNLRNQENIQSNLNSQSQQSPNQNRLNQNQSPQIQTQSPNQQVLPHLHQKASTSPSQSFMGGSQLHQNNNSGHELKLLIEKMAQNSNNSNQMHHILKSSAIEQTQRTFLEQFNPQRKNIQFSA